ncbi:MAG: chromosome segregation protein SMC, partial [Clostridia bacterium]|nr:chromosome segregation protein SMC [Clostridia bacterium]
MFLKSLQIQGFKSFPDKVKLEFKQGITATVGPNGSGKSNISDAVRWVLGEQAPSALRIKSMEDVIFDGTNARKAAGFAEVIINIDNTERWLSPDTDEVSVGRRYYRSGNSEYRINGKPALLREVNELFMDTGIGRDGYSMIGQGKISDIVDARAHDRRVIFEEAAGISKYRHRKHEAERNLDKTQENLTHLDVILSGLEERVGPLEKESEKAKKYLDLREKYKSAEIGLWLTILNKTTDVLRDQGYKLTLMDNQRAELEEAMQQLDAEADSIYAQSNALAAKKDESLRAASEMEEQALRLDGEGAVLDNDIRRDRADIERLEEEIRQAQGEGKEIATAITEQEEKLLQLEESEREHSDKIAGLRAEIEALRDSESGQNEQLGRLTSEQNKLTLELSEHQMTVTRAQSQLGEVSLRGETIAQTIAECRSRLEKLEVDERETTQALEAVREKADSLGNTVSGYRMRLDKQRRRAEEAKQQLDSLRLDAQDKTRRANTIEDLERNMEGYDYSVRKVMQCFEKGGLRGIHGPVSRVITVEDRYTVAIEIALGAAMKNIIVDNESDGKQAMEFLKQNRAGRATFLPISVIRPRYLDERGLDECAGYVDIASHLVTCDEKYRNILDNLLGKVCVVEDIDSAISIARRFKNRFRIVTLDGQVINAGGSMTGGSLDKNIGLLSRRG